MILHVQKICYQAFANVRRANITNDPELVQTRVHFRRGGARAQTHGKAVRAFCSASSLAPSLGFQPAVSSARSKARSRPDGYASSQRRHGERLADATKAKIRNLMSVLFNHAIRYEWLEQGRNPITLVRQSAQRRETYWEYMRIDRLTVTSMEVS